jgi:exosortase A-associated hydrolase 1
MLNESPVVFECQGEKLVGIIHESTSKNNVGILIVVGGPQYRIGSHRQFVLLSRFLAKNDFPSMRFDVRGMGDARGEQRRFDMLDDDINAAMDCFMASRPDLKGIIIWGLCDAASAALFYAYQDERVTGLVLLNPWVFTEQGAAKTYIKHYYLQRILSRDFWKKVFAFKVDILSSLVSLVAMYKKAMTTSISENNVVSSNTSSIDQNLPLPVRMRECFKRFGKPVLLILSGRDLTADEFKQVVADDLEWQLLLNTPQVTRQDFVESDHTFSSAAWRDQVAEWTLQWINKL